MALALILAVSCASDVEIERCLFKEEKGREGSSILISLWAPVCAARCGPESTANETERSGSMRLAQSSQAAATVVSSLELFRFRCLMSKTSKRAARLYCSLAHLLSALGKVASSPASWLAPRRRRLRCRARYARVARYRKWYLSLA